MEDFIDLSLHCTYQTFNLYPIGYQTEKLIHYNAAKGNPVNIYNSVAHEHMPNIYKQHNWLVYTACEKMATVGWPLCLMEAQAAGLGVCMKNLRPDLNEYLGGAGVLYDSLDELADIIAKPVPEDIRNKGFENSKKADINNHIHLLKNILVS